MNAVRSPFARGSHENSNDPVQGPGRSSVQASSMAVLDAGLTALTVISPTRRSWAGQERDIGFAIVPNMKLA